MKSRSIAAMSSDKEKLKEFRRLHFEQTGEVVRWFEENNDNEDLLKKAANYQDELGDTPLHYLVRERHPPYDLLVRILQLAPDTVIVQDINGDLPIHRALTTETSPDVLNLLRETYPEGLMVQNKYGDLPLHKALQNYSPPDVVKMLFEACPEAVHVQNKDECLPLHLACYLKAYPDIVRMIFEAYPEAVGVQNKDGSLPLHAACLFKASPDIVKMLFEPYPDAVKVQDHDGYLPLHLSCLFKASPDVILMLFEAYPDAVKVQNSYGDLPLHYALYNSSSSEIMTKLLEAYPKATQVQDFDGNLPLHEVLHNCEAPPEVVKMVLEEYPTATAVENQQGDLPLHIACSSKASSEVVKMIFLTYPSAAKVQNKDGYLPLHYAFSNMSSEVTQLLFEAYPEAVEVKNNIGNLPLHEGLNNQETSHHVIRMLLKACPQIWISCKTTPGFMNMLLRAYPSAAHEKNEQGYMLLHLACTFNAPREHVQKLLEVNPSAAKIPRDNGQVPLHIACKVNASPDILNMVLDAYPRAATLQDSYGFMPIHYARRNGASPEVISNLVRAFQENHELNDNFPKVQLYRLCYMARWGETSLETIQQWLINNNDNQDLLKEAINYEDEISNLPLHHLVAAHPQLELVEMFIQLAPETVLKKNKYDWLPLHVASYKNASFNVVKMLLCKCPGSEKKQTNCMKLPLHLACMGNASRAVVEMLVEKYPGALWEQDKDGRLPLHFCCKKHTSIDVMRLLLQAYPKAAEQQDNDGMLPLHFAFMKSVSFEMISVLLEQYPKAADVKEKKYGKKVAELKNQNGFTLLHYACYYGFSNSLLEVIVDSNPKACTIKDYQGRRPWELLKINGLASSSDDNGRFPLHHACQKGASLYFLKLLLDAYPECVYKTDIYGKTPSKLLEESGAAAKSDGDENKALLLHCACSFFCNEGSIKNLENLVRLLIKANPKGIKAEDRNRMTPLHYSCSYANSEESLRCLVTILVENDAEPLEVINARDKRSRTPLFILMKRAESDLTCSGALDFIVKSEVVKFLVEKGAKIGEEEENETSPLFLAESLLSNQSKDAPQLLQLYLQLKPKANSKFFLMLQRLRENDRKEAVLDSYVQQKVQEAVNYRLPTLFLMLDSYFIVAGLVCFGIAVTRYNNYLFNDSDSFPSQVNSLLWVVITGGIYYFMREVMQAYSFYSIGYFTTWLSDPTEHLDILCVLIMLVWPSLMLTQSVNKESNLAMRELFRTSSTFAAGCLFLLVFSLLKRISFNFAVFVRGFVIVFINLFSFSLVLVITITAFALMFYSMFSGVNENECGQFCSFWSSWFEVYNMILGSYGPDILQDATDTSKYGIYVLYFLLGIIAVIVLLNVLIAVVVDSYGAVKNENSEEAFWSSRLQYVTEVEVISNWFKTRFSFEFFARFASMIEIIDSKKTKAWESLINVYEDKHSDKEKAKSNELISKSLSYLFTRLIVNFYIVVWVVLGAVSAGLLWPPQIREWLWVHQNNEDSPNGIQDQAKANTLEGSSFESMVEVIKAELEKIQGKNDKTSEEIQCLRNEMARIKSDVIDMIEKQKAEINLGNAMIVQMIDDYKTEVKGNNNHMIEVSNVLRAGILDISNRLAALEK